MILTLDASPPGSQAGAAMVSSSATSLSRIAILAIALLLAELASASQATAIGPQIDGKTLLNPTYNNRAQLSSLASPARTVAYVPDAFGRPTQLGTYVTGIQYHPNGLPSSYTVSIRSAPHRFCGAHRRVWRAALCRATGHDHGCSAGCGGQATARDSQVYG
jgi:hypothetical protein